LLLNLYRTEIVSLAARHRLTTIYPRRFFSELGGLLSYASPRTRCLWFARQKAAPRWRRTI